MRPYMCVLLLAIACLAQLDLAQPTDGPAKLRKMQAILEALQTERKGKNQFRRVDQRLSARGFVRISITE